MAISKPFTVKGIKVTSPIGSAMWCKVVEPDYRYNPEGIYEVSLVLSKDKATPLITQLTNIVDTATKEAKEGKGDMKLAPNKVKTITNNEVYKDEYDAEGNETGNVIFKFSLKDVDKLPDGKNKIAVFNAEGKPIANVPLVGNGSTIRVRGFANPYYMASTNAIGIALKWEALQIIDLVAFSGGEGFDAVDGSFVDEDEEIPFKNDSEDDF